MLTLTRKSLVRPTTILIRGLASSSSSTFIPPPPVLSPAPPHLLTLADLNVSQIQSLISSALAFKRHYKANAVPEQGKAGEELAKIPLALKSLDHKTVALMFSKRSTRTRVATESAVHMLGGHPMFLGSQDIQLGVNESLYDTSRVVSSMVDGIMARVGDHSEIETLAANSSVPVINALSSLYHPTQILADLQTLLELHGPFSTYLSSLSGLTVTWIGDSNNILNEMLVTYPRLGINLNIATPRGYDLDPVVLERMEEGLSKEGGSGKVFHTNDPLEALKGADVVTTDTWISMGQESESAQRLKDFSGYQITQSLLSAGGAKPGCMFMHCLPRHQEEVDDEVFYGEKSVVFQEAENRKWTILAVMDAFVGRWTV
ncbi:putative ornithine carbamoyltransferase [Meredithblackwellia eburnea MCA 4105]